MAGLYHDYIGNVRKSKTGRVSHKISVLLFLNLFDTELLLESYQSRCREGGGEKGGYTECFTITTRMILHEEQQYETFQCFSKRQGKLQEIVRTP